MSKLSKPKISIIWALAQQFSTQIIGLLVTVIMARLIMPEEYGLMGLVYVYAAIATVLVEGGLTHSLIRTPNPDNEDFSSVFFANLIVSLVLYIILFFCAPFISEFYNQDILTSIIRVYSLTFLISSFSVVQNTILIKSLKFKTILLINLPSLFISSIVGVILAVIGYGVWSLVWSAIVKSFLLTVQFWYYSSWRPTFKINKLKLKYHFSFGFKIALMEIINSIYANIFQLFIGKYFSIAKVGYFTQANTLKQIPVSNIYGGINKVAFPLLAESSNDDAKMKEIYRKLLKIMIFVITPLMVYLYVFGEPILIFLFTERWLPALPFLKILCFSGMLHPLVVFNMNIFKVKGRSDMYLILGVINKFFITIGIVLSIKYGIELLLWSQVFSYFISFLLNSYYMGKLIEYNLFNQIIDLLPIFMISLITGLIMIYIFRIIDAEFISNFVKLLVGGVSGLVIYISLAFLFKLKEISVLKEIIFVQK